MEGQSQTAGAVVRFSVQLSLGGAAFGLAVGVVTTTWLRTMYDNRMAEITVTVRPPASFCRCRCEANVCLT